MDNAMKLKCYVVIALLVYIAYKVSTCKCSKLNK